MLKTGVIPAPNLPKTRLKPGGSSLHRSPPVLHVENERVVHTEVRMRVVHTEVRMRVVHRMDHGRVVHRMDHGRVVHTDGPWAGSAH